MSISPLSSPGKVGLMKSNRWILEKKLWVWFLLPWEFGGLLFEVDSCYLGSTHFSLLKIASQFLLCGMISFSLEIVCWVKVCLCVCVCRGGQGAVMIQSKPIRFSQELDSWPEEHSVNAGVCSLPWKWPEQTVHARTVSEVFSPCSLRKCLSFSLFSTFWFAWCFQW